MNLLLISTLIMVSKSLSFAVFAVKSSRMTILPAEPVDEDSNDTYIAKDNEKGNKVIVGSTDYYKGFLKTDLGERRSDGIDQTMKLAGISTGVLAVFFCLFLKSNNLL